MLRREAACIARWIGWNTFCASNVFFDGMVLGGPRLQPVDCGKKQSVNNTIIVTICKDIAAVCNDGTRKNLKWGRGTDSSLNRRATPKCLIAM